MKTTCQQSLQSQVEAIDWSFAESETQALTHAVHRYSGKFIPAVARQAIELLSQPGETILDPFAGSGTTLLEAILLGRNAIGVDLNPLACLIARVKTTVVAEKEVRASVNRVCSKLACYGDNDASPFLFSPSKTTEQQNEYRTAWFLKWFHPERLEELIFVKSVIDAEANQKCRDMLLVAFSDVVRAASNAHGGYPNVMFDKHRQKPQPVIPRFIKRLAEVSDAVVSLTEHFSRTAKCSILRGDASALQLPNESADAIVTHPPYIGSIPYAEYGQLSLKWLGHDPKELDKALLGGRRQSRDVQERFVEGYKGFFSSCHAALKSGRHLFVLVGNPLVRGKRVDLAEISKYCAQHVGFSTVAETTRRAINRRANLMGDETILIFSKPKADNQQNGFRSNGTPKALNARVVTAKNNAVCNCEK